MEKDFVFAIIRETVGPSHTASTLVSKCGKNTIERITDPKSPLEKNTVVPNAPSRANILQTLTA